METSLFTAKLVFHDPLVSLLDTSSDTITCHSKMLLILCKHGELGSLPTSVSLVNYCCYPKWLEKALGLYSVVPQSITHQRLRVDQGSMTTRPIHHPVTTDTLRGEISSRRIHPEDEVDFSSSHCTFHLSHVKMKWNISASYIFIHPLNHISPAPK